jgi:HEAT repeat protein
MKNKKISLPVMSLIHQLRHVDPNMRREALEELIVLKATPAALAISLSLKDKDPTIRALAGKALGILKSEETLDSLIEALGDEDENVNYWIVYAISQFKSEDVFEKISWALTDKKLCKYAFSIVAKFEGIGIDKVIELLSYDNWKVRSLAAETLIELGEIALEKVKTEINKTDNVDALYWLLRVLGRIGDNESVEILKKYAESEKTDLRKAAVEGLYFLGNYESILYLKELLSSSYEDVRFYAVNYLGDFGVEYLENIIEKFEDPSWSVRDAASKAASKSGREIMAIFENMLINGSKNQRFCALKTLSYFGEDGLSSLLYALDDPFWAIRRMASDKLVDLGNKAVPVLIKNLTSSKTSDEKKFWIIRALGKIRDNRVVEELVRFLNYPNKDIRFATVKALARIGDKSVVAKLIDSLTLQSEEAKYWSIKTLGQLGKEAISSLMKKLSDPNWNVRKIAAEALGEIGEEAIEELLQGLQDKDKDVRYWSHKALVKIGYKATDGIIELLKHPNWQVRREAADTLKDMGPQIIPKMMVKLRVFNEHYQYWIPRIVASMKSKIALKELKEFLQKGTKEERVMAIEAIGEIAILEDKDLRKLLVDSLTDEFWEVRVAAAKVVGKLKIQEAAESLLENVLDSDPLLRANAAFSLGIIEVEAAADILVDLLDDVDYRVRSNAVRALGYLKPKKKKRLLIKKLLEILLYYDQGDLRKAVIWTLGELKSKESVKELIHLFKDNIFLQESIIEALGKIACEECVDFIKKVLLSKKHGTNLRIKALEEFLKLSPPKEVESILKKLVDDVNLHLRKYAFREMYRANLVKSDAVEKLHKKYGRKKKEEVLYRRALKYLKEKNIKMAISLLMENISKYPDFKDSYLKLIQILIEKNMLEEAKKIALKLLKKFPKNESALTSVGYIFFQQGDYTKAASFLNETLKVAKSSANISIAKKILKKLDNASQKS